MTAILTQAEAYALESAIFNGESKQNLFNMLERSSIKDDTFSNLARKDPERFMQALSNGYKISFPTINGVKNILKMRFQLLENKDYQLSNNQFHNLTLSSDQIEAIQLLFEPTWQIVRSGNQINLVHRSHLSA